MAETTLDSLVRALVYPYRLGEEVAVLDKEAFRSGKRTQAVAGAADGANPPSRKALECQEETAASEEANSPMTSMTAGACWALVRPPTRLAAGVGGERVGALRASEEEEEEEVLLLQTGTTGVGSPRNGTKELPSGNRAMETGTLVEEEGDSEEVEATKEEEVNFLEAEGEGEEDFPAKTSEIPETLATGAMESGLRISIMETTSGSLEETATGPEEEIEAEEVVEDEEVSKVATETGGILAEAAPVSREKVASGFPAEEEEGGEEGGLFSAAAAARIQERGTPEEIRTASVVKTSKVTSPEAVVNPRGEEEGEAEEISLVDPEEGEGEAFLDVEVTMDLASVHLTEGPMLLLTMLEVFRSSSNSFNSLPRNLGVHWHLPIKTTFSNRVLSRKCNSSSVHRGRQALLLRVSACHSNNSSSNPLSGNPPRSSSPLHGRGSNRAHLTGSSTRHPRRRHRRVGTLPRRTSRPRVSVLSSSRVLQLRPMAEAKEATKARTSSNRLGLRLRTSTGDSGGSSSSNNNNNNSCSSSNSSNSNNSRDRRQPRDSLRPRSNGPTSHLHLKAELASPLLSTAPMLPLRLPSLLPRRHRRHLPPRTSPGDRPGPPGS